jgi:hypothetical protein
MKSRAASGGYSEAVTTWERDRRELSHQVVKNSLLSHAERLALAQRLGSAEVTQEESDWLRAAWADSAPRLRSLVGDFESACSPSQVLAQLLEGDGVAAEVRSALMTELHAEWCAALSTAEWTERARSLIDEFDSRVSAPEPDGAAIEAACRRLSETLHDYPTRDGPI